MMEFLNTPAGTVTLIVVAAAALAYLWYKGYRGTVRKIIYALVIQAEKTLGNGTGEFKYALVTGWVYERLPLILRALISEKEIDEMIEWAVEQMKQSLNDSPKLAQSFTAQLPS